MNKKMIIAIASGILVLCIIIAAVAIFSKKPDDNAVHEDDDIETCFRHIDLDNDGLCDTCGAEVGISTVGDPTMDVNVAVNLINNIVTAFNSNKSFNMTGMTVQGELADELQLNIPSDLEVTVDDNKVLIKNGSNYKYIFTETKGKNIVYYDGAEYVIESIATNNRPEYTFNGITTRDIFYDGKNKNFVFNDDAINTIMKNYMSEFVIDFAMLESQMGLEGMVDALSNLTYSATCKVNQDAELEAMFIRGNREVNGTTVEVFYATLSHTNKTLTLNLNFNLDIKLSIDFTFDSKDGSDTEYIFTCVTTVLPTNNTADEIAFEIKADLILVDRDLVVSDELRLMLESAENNLDKQAALASKYSGKFIMLDDSCELYSVYDQEFDVYVYFTYDETNDTDIDMFVYNNFSTFRDAYACLVDVNFDTKTLTLKEHSEMESAYGKARIKYQGTFTSLYTCKVLVVYDEELDAYIWFMSSIFNKQEYTFVDVMDEYDSINYCLATVDLQTKTLTMQEHGKLEYKSNYYQNEVYYCNEVFQCSTLCIYDEELKLYFLFGYDLTQEGYVSYGYTTEGIGCEATLDVNTKTFSIVKHNCSNE